MPHMAKGRLAKRQQRRADLGVGNNLDAKDVGEARAAVAAEGAEDEVLAFLVEDEDAGEHAVGIEEARILRVFSYRTVVEE